MLSNLEYVGNLCHFLTTYVNVNVTTGTCYIAFLLTRHSRSAQACFVPNTQFYLFYTFYTRKGKARPGTLYIRNELANVAAHFTDPERMEA